MKSKMTRPRGSRHFVPPHKTLSAGLISGDDAQRSGVYASRDQLILNHLCLAKGIAVRIYENLRIDVELEDLIHAGVLGLFDAVKKYDPSKQVPFSSYAKHRIRVGQLDLASREIRRRQSRG
jgi:DNA-directed RNA polymerase specialized sigma subunit